MRWSKLLTQKHINRTDHQIGRKVECLVAAAIEDGDDDGVY